MKTIFIPIYHAFTSRNILRTDVFNILKENNKLIIFIPNDKEGYYLKNFKHENVEFIGTTDINEGKKLRFLRKMARFLFNSGSIYWFLKVERATQMSLFKYIYNSLLSKLGTFKIFRDIIKSIYQSNIKDNIYLKYFEKYKPDLVFIPDIYRTNEIYMALAAKQKNVKTIGMVRSWDNILGKGTCLIDLDRLIVHNENMKKEAIKYLGYQEKDIEVVGLPHFDYYLNFDPTLKNEFYNKLGLNENDKYVLFVPYFGTYTEATNEILEIFQTAVAENKLSNNLKLVLRMPQSYTPGFIKLFEGKNIVVDYPCFKYEDTRKSSWEFTDEDMKHLADSIHYSEIVINFASTLTLDAAAFDKPIINIKFDGYKNKKFAFSMKQIYKVEHWKYVFKTGGTKYPESIDQFINNINTYLNNPSEDKEARSKLINNQAFKFDDMSGKRAAEYIISQL